MAESGEKEGESKRVRLFLCFASQNKHTILKIFSRFFQKENKIKTYNEIIVDCKFWKGAA